jgi:hypothetical protein
MLQLHSVSYRNLVRPQPNRFGSKANTPDPDQCAPLKPHVWAQTPTGIARGKQLYAVVETAPTSLKDNIQGFGVDVKRENPTQPYFFLYVLNQSTKKELEKHLTANQKALKGIRWEIEVRGQAQL